MGEYEYVGWVSGKPVAVIPGPYSGLPIPAASEIVIEGEVPHPHEKNLNRDGGFHRFPKPAPSVPRGLFH